MKKLCVMSMLVLSIVGNALCQKVRVDTTLIFMEKSPPIVSIAYDEFGTYTITPNIKRNPNHIVIDFGKKNVLKVDYQGTKAFAVKNNVDTLLANFWNDYSLIRDTLNKNLVKKITYHGKNKDMKSRAIMEIQYYPQREVFQFGRSVELVRLKQDTLLLIDYEMEFSTNHHSNTPVKSFKNQSFLLNLNSIEDVEEVIDFGVNQAIMEASERAEAERKNTYPWKHVNIRSDLMTQKTKSSIKGPALFDILSFHADVGLGLNTGGNLLYSSTAAIDFVSSKYYKKGFVIGIQSNDILSKETNFTILNKPTFFTGISFYKKKENRNEFKGGLFLGISKEERFTLPTTNQSAISFMQTKTLKFFGWYQLTPLIRLQPEIIFLQFKKINQDFMSNPILTKPAFSSGSNIAFRLSFGI